MKVTMEEREECNISPTIFQPIHTSEFKELTKKGYNSTHININRK